MTSRSLTNPLVGLIGAKSILQLFYLLVFSNVVVSVALSKKYDVSIPPLLEEGPEAGELLFDVGRDPESEGHNLTIPCKADALPPPTYFWFKNGLHFNPESHEAFMVDGEGTLVFPEPSADDEGDYQCVATNSAGSVYSDIAHVRRSTIISFPKGEPRVITAVLGEPLALHCDNPGGYPVPALHWVIQESDGSLHSVTSERATVDSDGTLWFSSVTKEDASEDTLYACAASSATRERRLQLFGSEEEHLIPENGDDEKYIDLKLSTEYRMGNWVYLNVTEDKSRKVPMVEPFLQKVSEDEHHVLEGDDLKMYCIYGGNPVPSVRWWRKDRREISEDHVTDFGKALEFNDISAHDEGDYYCQASNDVGKSDIQSFEIIVEAAPKFLEEPETISQPVGESATFRCSAEGVPPPDITWSIDGEPLEGNNKESLHFPVLKMGDKGVVACNASNRHGYVYSTGFLNVLSLPPVFTLQPENTSGFAGQSITLSCKGYGAPDPRVMWSKIPTRGREKFITKNSKGYQISQDALTIRSLSEDTAGEYRCKVSNRFGIISEVVTVEIKRSTVVSVGLSSSIAKAGDSVTIRCDVTTDDDVTAKVTWLKDDEPLDLDDDRIIDTESDEEGRDPYDRVLVIRNSNGADSGIYSCLSKTDQDQSQGDVILTVEDVPNAPKILEVECSKREAYIHWDVPGQNNSPIIGYIVQTQTDIHKGKWNEIENDIKPKQNELKVSLRPGLSHKFRVIAVNRVGSSPPSDPSDDCHAPGAPPDNNPEDVTVFNVDSNTVKLTWEPMEPKYHNGNDFRYVIRWKRISGDVIDDDDDDDDATFVENENKGNKWRKLIIEDWEQKEAEIDGLRENSRYKIRVSAENEFGSAVSPEDVWFSTNPDAPVLSPTFLRVRRITATTAIVFWIPVRAPELLGDIEGYEIDIEKVKEDSEEEDDDDDDDEDELITDGQTSHAKLTGLDPFTEYEARVRVRSSRMTGPFSKTLVFRTAEGTSSPVQNLESTAVSHNDIILAWDPPENPRGIIHDYQVKYYPGTGTRTKAKEALVDGEFERVKIADLEEDTEYTFVVIPRNDEGNVVGQEASVEVQTHSITPSKPSIPIFSWSVVESSDDTDVEALFDRDNDNDIDAEDIRLQGVVVSDTDGDGDIDRDDILDLDNDGDIDQDDFDVADINNDGEVDEDDVAVADRDGDGDVDKFDIGDEDGDGDFDFQDVLKADEDGDGDIDASDDDEENIILQDVDGDGDIDEDDSIDVDKDGDIDEDDLKILDIDNDGDIDGDDLILGDKDGDGDVDAADVFDFDEDGTIDEDDFNIKDVDGDGDIDRMDYLFRSTFVGDTDGDGDIDAEDVLDVDGDGDIDQDDFDVADINNDGRVDEKDLHAADRDGDGDVDAADIGDEDGDGDIDGSDVIAADEDGDGDIDESDDDEEGVLFEDRDNDGDLDEDDVTDMDGDGDVDARDFAILDVNDDGKIDAEDLKIIDKDGDGDVDSADVADFNNDGKIDEADLEIIDKDGDGDIDATDIQNQRVYLKDIDNDGDIDIDDVLDIDGDGDIDDDDVRAADLDDDGDVDEDDLRKFDRDGDGDIDANDARDFDGDGKLDEDDFDATDRDGDGDIDELDWANRAIFLSDTDRDGDIDEDDVLDTDGDGDIDKFDFDVADINNDGKINRKDILAGDVDGDGDIDIADIGDEDGDGDIDGKDVIAADEDGDGDIDAEDDDGDSILLMDRDGDGDIDMADIIDVDGDGDVDEADINALDIDNDGDVDEEDLRRADKDGDGDIDAADIRDVDGDGDVDASDIIMSDRDGDGDIDASDSKNRNLILGDSDGDGDIDADDVLDTDNDGDIDEDDFAIADINNDGKISIDDVRAADLDDDGDIDINDIRDIDGDGDIDGRDVLASDADGDGDIDSADQGKGVAIVVDWMPDLTENPGSEFYVKYRPVGQNIWQQTAPNSKTLSQELSGLSPYTPYELQMVAKDGSFETVSESQIIGPFARASSLHPNRESQPMETNPAHMTWFVVAILVVMVMFLTIVCSVWVYRRRLARVSELRAELYKDYKPPPVVKPKSVDVEAAIEKDGQEPLTAESQRQQISSLLNRQETVQSVDSFASHDDDFAEYGDESMAIDLLNSVSMLPNSKKQGQTPKAKK